MQRRPPLLACLCRRKRAQGLGVSVLKDIECVVDRVPQCGSSSSATIFPAALLIVLQKTVPKQEILLFYKEGWNTPNIEVRRPRQGKGYTYAA
jgi:hypothetical protein